MAQLLLEKFQLENGKPNLLVWEEEQICIKLRAISIPALRESGLLDRIMMQPDAISLSDTGVDKDLERISNADIELLLEIASELLS